MINRGFLYAGVFLVAIGAVLLAADWALLDTPALTGVLRLWPLALLAIGVGLVLRRTQFGLAAGLAAALIPAVFVGSALAVAPRYAANCGAPDSAQPAVETTGGSLVAPATVAVRADCGTLSVSTVAGDAWQLQASNTYGHPAQVIADTQSLTVGEQPTSDHDFFGDDLGRDVWSLSLPTSQISNLSIHTEANQSEINLAGAQIDRLDLEAGLSTMNVDASQASIANLVAVVELGSLSINLPPASISGELRAGASDLRVCTPPGVGLRVTNRSSASEIAVADLRLSGSEWQSPDYATATHRIDLSVKAEISSVEINPTGGC